MSNYVTFAYIIEHTKQNQRHYTVYVHLYDRIELQRVIHFLKNIPFALMLFPEIIEVKSLGKSVLYFT